MNHNLYARQLRDKLFNPPNAWRPPVAPPPEEAPKEPRRIITGTREALVVICNFCAKAFKVESSDIKSDSRISGVTLARQMIYYLATAHLGIRISQVARFLHRDHTSVICGRNRIYSLLDLEGGTLSDRIRSVEQEFLDLHYPSFALTHLRKPNLEVKASWKGKKGSVSKPSLRGLESRGGRRMDEAKGEAANSPD